MKSFREILSAACAERDHPWALATLVGTKGSTYRQPGARLLVSPQGETIGVLSGGCLEEEIARLGMEVIASGVPCMEMFDTRKLFGCDGRLEIYIERIPAGANFLTDMAAVIARREICRVRVPFADRGSSSVMATKDLVAEMDGVFMQTVPLPTRLLLFGSGPEISPVKLFAAGLGWITADHVHPDELPSDFKPDNQTAAVVMTHKFGRDLAALDRLLPLGLPYVGLLGPKRRHAELLARFQDFKELDPAWLESLHAPAGLDIGSESPEEIALSIVSEAAAVLSKCRGGFLRERATAIHRIEARA